MTKDQSLQLAVRLKEEFKIGNWSGFCDEFDFETVSDEELSQVILDICGE